MILWKAESSDIKNPTSLKSPADLKQGRKESVLQSVSAYATVDTWETMEPWQFCPSATRRGSLLFLKSFVAVSYGLLW